MGSPAVERAESVDAVAVVTSQAIPHAGPATAAAAQVPWPSRDRSSSPWAVIGYYPNFWEAHIVRGVLENEGIPTLVHFTWPDMGASHSLICVPGELARRAMWILAWEPPTEAELVFLATGETVIEPAASEE